MTESELARKAAEIFSKRYPNGWAGSQEEFVQEIELIKEILKLENPTINPIFYFFNKIMDWIIP